MSLCWVFIVTFIVFPAAFFKAGFSFDQGHGNDPTTEKQLDATYVNLIFNLMDTIGRWMGGKYVLSSRTTIGLSILRTVFIFTTLACAVFAEPAWLFQSDWFRVTNQILFAFTNGYVSTMCMVLAPQTVQDSEAQNSAGLFGSIFLCLGITFGSIINIPVGEIYK